jgi:hypothetical protein
MGYGTQNTVNIIYIILIALVHALTTMGGKKHCFIHFPEAAHQHLVAN